jgi:hypothetical protein
MCKAKCISSLNKKGMQALNDGDLVQAEVLMRQALEKAILLDSQTFQAKIRNNLGLILQSKGSVVEAAHQFFKALTTAEERIGSDNFLYATIDKNYRSLCMSIN